MSRQILQHRQGGKISWEGGKKNSHLREDGQIERKIQKQSYIWMGQTKENIQALNPQQSKQNTKTFPHSTKGMVGTKKKL